MLEKQIKLIEGCHDIACATKFLYASTAKTKLIQKALDFTVKSHEGQFRKSGEAYAIHPILVASFVTFLGGDEAMVASALLHDVVEDTCCSIDEIQEEFGGEVAKLVEGLTKIMEIRQDELVPSTSNESLVKSALSFHKMLLASISDVRVLVIKLCDRLHNMLTIDALSEAKQKRISEETLLVYAPIAHRLGISSVKNKLEDLSFKYVLPSEYEKIDKFISEHKQQLTLRLNHFIDKTKILMMQNGFTDSSFTIHSRIKHYYSIYLKMQRKGISIEEVLDLVAIRVLVKKTLDCYKVLGILHSNFNPLIARFKDYVAIPKENGYQTIHTTLFDKTAIIEAQIRTFDMDNTAELGVAAHWKYKSSGISPSLTWLNELDLLNAENEEQSSIEEFYEYAKGNLYSEDISVFSPKGDIYTFSRGSIVLDFAYEIHTQVGIRAKEAYVNRQKVPLVTELRNGDVVEIVVGDEIRPRCSWINIVQTPKARSAIRQNCRQKIRDIDAKSAYGILANIFNVSHNKIEEWVENANLSKNISRAAYDLNYLRDCVGNLKKYAQSKKVLFPLLNIDRYKLRKHKFENIVIYSNHKVDGVEFDYCCHPKKDDDILAIKNSTSVIIHHKLCSQASKLVNNEALMSYVRWSNNTLQRYRLIVSIENNRGSLASFLFYLSRMEIDLSSIELSRSEEGEADYFKLIIELSEKANAKQIQRKIREKYKLIEFVSLDDAYQ